MYFMMIYTIYKTVTFLPGADNITFALLYFEESSKLLNLPVLSTTISASFSFQSISSIFMIRHIYNMTITTINFLFYILLVLNYHE